MSSSGLHGVLLVDKIKLSEHLHVTSPDRIKGFVNLGPFTTDGQAVPSDVEITMMLVPFASKWTQVIGVFATSGNAKAEL